MRRTTLLFLALAACSSSGPSDSPSDTDQVNIGLNNQTGRTIAVTMSVSGKWNSGAVGVNSGQYKSGEYGPTAAGDNIIVTAVTTSGSPTVTSTPKTCRPKAAIIGSTVYGQIDFGLDGSTMFVNCSSIDAWQ